MWLKDVCSILWNNLLWEGMPWCAHHKPTKLKLNDGGNAGDGTSKENTTVLDETMRANNTSTKCSVYWSKLNWIELKLSTSVSYQVSGFAFHYQHSAQNISEHGADVQPREDTKILSANTDRKAKQEDENGENHDRKRDQPAIPHQKDFASACLGRCPRRHTHGENELESGFDLC